MSMRKETTKATKATKVQQEQVQQEQGDTNTLPMIVTKEPKVTVKALESASGEIVKKYTIKLASPLKNGSDTCETTNLIVAQTVDYIQRLTDVTESAELTKCRFMADMAKDDNFKALGFESMQDFAKHVFAIERTACNAYVNIGKLFVGGTSENPVLWEYIPSGYGKSHLLEIINVLPTDLMQDVDANKKDLLLIVESLINNGVLTSNLSTSAIRAKLKAARESVEEDGTKTYNLKEAGKAGRKAKSEAKNEAKTETETPDVVDSEVVAKAVLINAKLAVEKCENVVAGIGETEKTKLSSVITMLTELISELTTD